MAALPAVSQVPAAERLCPLCVAAWGFAEISPGLGVWGEGLEQQHFSCPRSFRIQLAWMWACSLGWGWIVLQEEEEVAVCGP